MTTAETLKAITDRSKFEKIGSDILREKFPELKDLIEAGLNEKGESVPSPVDAFAPITKDLYGYIEYTTDDSNLEKKWLKEDIERPGKEGDLIKAVRVARQKRLANPSCKFRIFLVTNQRVSPELENKVQEKVPENFIEVKIIELSILQNFLDTDPVGQYLRWKHLGIKAELLSQPLLREILYENLSKYSAFISTTESSLVDNSAIQELSTSVKRLTTKLALVVAPSGGGKSAASFSLAMKAYHAGEIVIRLEPNVIADSTGLTDAIERQLRRHYQGFYTVKDSLQQLFSGSPLIVIDDINNNNPGVLLDKIVSWIQDAELDNFKIICPVLPQNIGLIKNGAVKENLYQTLKLNPISRKEGAEFIKQSLARHRLSLPDSQIIEILNVTRQDPLLMTFYLDRIIKSGGFIANHGQQIIEWYVQENINDLSSKASLTTNRFVSVLDALGYYMLSSRNLHPTYSLLRKYFSDTGRDFDTFEKLAVNRKLFYAEPDDTIVFRHDRIRDYLMTASLENLLPAADSYSSIIEDPYYSQWIGAAISRRELSHSQIDQLLPLNPPAVFYALKFIQGDEQQTYFDRIANKINQWNAQIRTNNITHEACRSAAFALLTFDTRDIMKITEGLPECLELYLARFRNGETNEGIRYYACQEWFPPTSSSYWRDVVLDHVLQVRYEKTLKDIESHLNQQLSEKGRPNTYLLAGYLGSHRLLPALQNHWNNNKNENELHFYLWAVLNCFNSEYLSTLTEALDYWATLKVDPKRKYQSRGIKNDVVHELTGIRWEFNDDQINQLVTLGANSSYSQLIFGIISFLDSPAALGAVIKRLADQGSPLEQEVFSDAVFDDDRWDVRRGRTKLSEPARAFLFNHWKDKTNPDKERYRAFRYWCGNESDAIVLAELKSIAKEDASLYEFSLNWRRRLRDMTVIPEYLQLAEKDLNYMLQADEIWNEDVKAYFKKFVAKTIEEKNPIRIGVAIEVLRKINQADAEEILVEFWDNIGWASHGFIIALLIATPKTRQLAASEIKRLGFGHWDRIKDYYQGPLRGYFIIPEVPWNLTQEEKANASFMADEFRHIHFLFGSLVDPGNRQLSLARLESLQPYFELMEDHGLSEIARQCRLSNYPEWVQKIAAYLSKESKKSVLPTQDDIMEELRHLEISKQAFDFDQYLEKLSDRLIDRDQFSMCIAKFAQSANSFAGLVIICRSLTKMGTRKQIPIIENYVMTEEQYHDKVAPLKANTIYKILRNSLL